MAQNKFQSFCFCDALVVCKMIAGVILTLENLTMHRIQLLLTNIWSNVLILWLMKSTTKKLVYKAAANLTGLFSQISYSEKHSDRFSNHELETIFKSSAYAIRCPAIRILRGHTKFGTTFFTFKKTFVRNDYCSKIFRVKTFSSISILLKWFWLILAFWALLSINVVLLHAILPFKSIIIKR